MTNFNVNMNPGYMPPAGYGAPAPGFTQGLGSLLANLGAATQLCAGMLSAMPPSSPMQAAPGCISGMLHQLGGLLQAVGGLLGGHMPCAPSGFAPAAGSGQVIGQLLSNQCGLMPCLGSPGSGHGVLGGTRPPLQSLLDAGVSPQLAGQLNDMWNNQVVNNIFTHGRRF